MDFEKPCCPVVNVDGNIACGKQFDLDITLPCDNRNVIYGVIRDCYKEPVSDAVVKLVEIVCECGKEERKPVSHTFTDEEGEFVFGPLCPDKQYEINFWVDHVKHVKVCAKCNHEGRCLKGVKMDKCDCFVGKNNYEHKEDYKDNYKNGHKEDYKDDYKENYKDECKEDYKKDYKDEHKEDYEEDYKNNHKEECNTDCKPDYKPEHKCDCKCNNKCDKN